MARGRRSILRTGTLLALFIGAVLVPAVLSVSLGIIALALQREAFDVVFGVLVLSFAALSIFGAVVGMAFVRRSARLAELQSDFIANVSHELRTPLAGIRLLVETLALNRITEPAQETEILERLGAEERKLEALVERILQWRRLGGGPSKLPRADCHPAEVIDEAITPLRVLAPDARIEAEVADDIPMISVVKHDLVTVIGNLVDNAIKFAGDRGPIGVDAHVDQGEVVFVISDAGPGIPHGEQRRIFEPFYRVPSQGRPGTGLGLAIVKRLIVEHGGRIRLESSPGEGCRFFVRLPVGTKRA